MFGPKSDYLNGQREKFARPDDLESGLSSPSSSAVTNKCGFNIEGLGRASHATKSRSKSFKQGMRKGSEGLESIGRSLGFFVSRAVLPEELKFSENKIFHPQDKFLLLCNKLFFVLCIVAVFIDPLFFYLPVFHKSSNCLGVDRKLAIIATTLRTVVDVFYLMRMALQFCTAYTAPSSRVFGRGALVTVPAAIAKRYLKSYFIVDFLAVLPVPQIFIWRFLHTSDASDVLATKQALLCVIWLQYIPRLLRIIPLTSLLKRTAGVFAESAWAGAVYYLLLYTLSSHFVGAFWYMLSVERYDTCWQRACKDSGKCKTNFLYCGDQNLQSYEAYNSWLNISESVLHEKCGVDGDNQTFDFGIFKQAWSSGIIYSKKFIPKYCYCLWWGLQNLSTLGQGLQTSSYPGESIFSIALATYGLILFASLLTGSMQTYLQSLTIRLEEMRIKRRDLEQWMHYRSLPQDLRERVRKYDQYKWLETRGVDEEALVHGLPKDLRRDIKRHLCLDLVTRVPLFQHMSETLRDAICERLKPCLFTEGTYIVREGDPVDEMLFIIRGRLESVTTDGGRSGFFNRSSLKEGDFCGDELLTWALDPRSGVNLPSSTWTGRALTEVEAFALAADDLKFVASQFRQLHSRQVQHIFRFYSQQWRTWASCFIQAAWRRYTKRKILELRPKEGRSRSDGHGSYSLAATFLASRFAANALRGVHRNRNLKSARELM